MRPRVLLVEDDRDLARGLVFNLEQERHSVTCVATASSARKVLGSGPTIDLVLLDLALPDGDGLDLIREWRSAGLATPIICLTARGQESDVVAGLRLGADDYVAKPFGVAQLLARMAAVLRRARSGDGVPVGELVDLAGVTVDLAAHRVTRSGRGGAGTPEGLTRIEADLLRYLLERRGRVLDRAQILGDLWGIGDRHATRTLDNHVARLRRKIELDPAKPRFLVTVHGIGYRFEE